MEQNLSKIGSKSHNWAKLQLLGWCADWHYWSVDWHILSLIQFSRFDAFSTFFLGYMAASKLKIYGECW